MQYYKKTERNMGAATKADTVYHSTTGAMHVSDAAVIDDAGIVSVDANPTSEVDSLSLIHI